MYILPALVLIVCVFVCQARTDIGSLARNLTPTLHKEYVKDDKLLHLSESTCIEGACPTGLFCKDEHFCQCGSYPFDVIHCNGTISSILNHNCASFDTTSNLTQVGSCPFIYVSPIGKQSKSVYRLLPRDPRELNNAMCKPLNRTGTICGRCLPNHYPLAYSLNLTCIHCPHVRWNWARYVMAAFIPITVFYFFILAFRVNIASSHMHPVVSYCQFLSIPIFSRITFADLALTANPRTLTVAKIMLSIYGIWNLDFFRPFYTDICLGLSTLPTFALDYVVAVYPFFLMLITYLLIVLYDRNFKVVVIIWKPFQTVFSFFKEKWNIRTSVINAFGTFFLFSNMKLLSITFDLLAPTTIFELHESGFNHSLGLYYAADIEYFGSEHLPYAILALVVLTLFIVIPVIIFTLYPFLFFQKFLNLLPVRWYVLHTFMDSFLGSYKDGMEPGTRDCQWFFSLFFWCRLALFISCGFKLNLMYAVTCTLILTLFVIAIIIVQPFKSSLGHYNTIHAVIILVLILFFLSLIGRSVSLLTMHDFNLFFTISAFITASVPLAYVLVVLLYCIWKQLGVFRKLKARRNEYRRLLDVDVVDESRLENPEAYHKNNLSNFHPTEN